jgi:hypothetical protein
MTKPESHGAFYIAAADQPHSHDEMKPSEPNDQILLRAGYTAAMTIQPAWGEIPQSVASTVRLSWWAPAFRRYDTHQLGQLGTATHSGELK